MAQATVTKRMVPQPPKEEIAGVQLSLTTEEVAVLLQVFEYIGGHPNKKRNFVPVDSWDTNAYDCNTIAPRGLIDRIARALKSTGIERSSFSVRTCNISFEDVLTD